MNKTTKYAILGLGLAFITATGCKKDDPPPTAPTVTTAALTNITTTSATAGGTITSDGGAAISASGIVLSRSNATPTLSDTVLTASATTGSFTVNLTDLVFGTTYYVRAYATNSAGTGYGNVVTMTTANDDTKVKFTYMGEEVVYGIIVSPTTGKKWLDRNLGASRVATSATDEQAFGDLFQWGRGDDGHQSRTSSITETLSTNDVPGNNMFIVSNTDSWRNPFNPNLWQGSSGINNPCPAGWHVPTRAEWEAETGITDLATAFSQLKIAGESGYRYGNTTGGTPGSIHTTNQGSRFWASTLSPSSTNAHSYVIGIGSPYTSGYSNKNGLPVRCIKD